MKERDPARVKSFWYRNISTKIFDPPLQIFEHVTATSANWKVELVKFSLVLEVSWSSLVAFICDLPLGTF